MKKSILIILLSLTSILFNQVFSQPYIDGNKRYSFAQTVVGLDLQYIPQSGKTSFMNNEGIVNESMINQTLTPRFTISGLHFWGHADLFVTIPFFDLLKEKKDDIDIQFSTSVETGFRLYPWRIEEHKLRPFIGLSMSTTNFKQQVTDQSVGALKIKTRTPIQTGFTFNHKKSLLELGCSFYPRNKFNYYIDRTTSATVETPKLAFYVGYKFYFDTSMPLTKALESGYLDRKTEEMGSQGLLDGLSIGLGFSSVFYLKKSPYNSDVNPYLDHFKSADGFLEWGLGYYFFKKDIHLNILYRSMETNSEAYDLKQKITRSSYAIEAYKFLGDYHGFAPFVGPVLSYENLTASEINNGQKTLDLAKNKISPGIVFGWDIRPSRLQSIVLRTNLRYFPGLYLKAENGKKINFDNLEFNFIQVVYYPGVGKRIKNYKLQ